MSGCKVNRDSINQNKGQAEAQNISKQNDETEENENDTTEEETSLSENEKEDEQIIESAEAESYIVKINEPYNSAGISVEILGLETYASLETDRYIDNAIEGQEYVVVYLKINNMSTQDEYFNYNDLQSYFDGEAVDTTYLINNPKDYQSIFNVLPANSETKGYLVYQVPKDWKELKIEYNGWEISRGIKLQFLLNATEIKEVEAFGSEFFAPYKNQDN